MAVVKYLLLRPTTIAILPPASGVAVRGASDNYHPNILVTNGTTLSQYLGIISDKINVEQYGYDSSTVESLTVMVWNADLLRNKRIKITREATGLRFTSGPRVPQTVVRKYSTLCASETGSGASLPLGQRSGTRICRYAALHSIKPLARRAKVGKPFYRVLAAGEGPWILKL